MIVLDLTEDSKKAGIQIRPYLESEVTVYAGERLEAGDLMFYGRDKSGALNIKIGMELKVSPHDLINSLRDGRLMEQLIKMTQEYHLPYLVTIGEPIRINTDNGKVREKRGRTYQDSRIPFHYLNSVLVRFEASGGRIRHVQDAEHLAAFILSMYHFWRKQEHTDEVYVDRRPFLDWKLLSNPIAEFYEKIEGIGIKHALTLAESYPIPSDLMQASVDDIAQLRMNGRRFGLKRAEKIYRFLRGINQ